MEQFRRAFRNDVHCFSRTLCDPPWSRLHTRATRDTTTCGKSQSPSFWYKTAANEFNTCHSSHRPLMTSRGVNIFWLLVLSSKGGCSKTLFQIQDEESFACYLQCGSPVLTDYCFIMVNSVSIIHENVSESENCFFEHIIEMQFIYPLTLLSANMSRPEPFCKRFWPKVNHKFIRISDVRGFHFFMLLSKQNCFPTDISLWNDQN